MLPRMIQVLLRAIPLPAFAPFRYCAAILGRRNPVRLACIPLLKSAATAYRGVLGSSLSEVRPLDNPRLSFEPSDSMVIDAVYWFGVRGYEGTVAITWARLCSLSTSVLEVGGNVGFFSVVGGVNTQGNYLVVEPIPRNVRILRSNLARNNLTKIEVLEAAAIPGKVPRAVQLNIPPEGRDHPVGAHLTAESEISDRGTQELLTVSGLPMIDLIDGRDLIKIDAEGIEHALIREIRGYIIERKPSLVIEVLPDSTLLGEILREISQEAGYNMYALPEYGRDDVVSLNNASFDSRVPASFNAKDVVLTTLVLGLAGSR